MFYEICESLSNHSLSPTKVKAIPQKPIADTSCYILEISIEFTIHLCHLKLRKTHNI